MKKIIIGVFSVLFVSVMIAGFLKVYFTYNAYQDIEEEIISEITPDTEIAETQPEEVSKTETPKPQKKVRWSRTVAENTRINLPEKTPETAQEPTPTPKPKEEGKTARERILNSASKSEISAGMAILSKVNLGKVNSLRKAGKTAELKAYIKSVLTDAEISRALSLYNKYKHLL